MNNFIAAEKFLKQSEKVQNELIKWWNPQVGDLVRKIIEWDYIKDKLYFTQISMVNETQLSIVTYNKETYIPLLQMYHLVSFIEDKGFYIVYGVMFYKPPRKIIKLYSNTGRLIKSYLAEDLLQALWQVVIELIEDN